MGRHASPAAKRRIVAARPASPRASRSGFPISVVIAVAISSARRSIAAAAFVKIAARRSAGSCDHEGNAAEAASTAAAASSAPDAANSPAISSGRHGLCFSYVRPEALSRHCPST
jgi:hypothetical protein